MGIDYKYNHFNSIREEFERLKEAIERYVEELVHETIRHHLDTEHPSIKELLDDGVYVKPGDDVLHKEYGTTIIAKQPLAGWCGGNITCGFNDRRGRGLCIDGVPLHMLTTRDGKPVKGIFQPKEKP